VYTLFFQIASTDKISRMWRSRTYCGTRIPKASAAQAISWCHWWVTGLCRNRRVRESLASGFLRLSFRTPHFHMIGRWRGRTAHTLFLLLLMCAAADSAAVGCCFGCGSFFAERLLQLASSTSRRLRGLPSHDTAKVCACAEDRVRECIFDSIVNTRSTTRFVERESAREREYARACVKACENVCMCVCVCLCVI